MAVSLLVFSPVADPDSGDRKDHQAAKRSPRDVANRAIPSQPCEDDLQLLLGAEFAVLALLCQLDLLGGRAAILRLASDASAELRPS